jgi:starch synthase
MALRVGFVSAEIAPFAKTGGLGDVAAALPRYLHAAGHDVRVFMPLYGRVDLRGQPVVAVSFLQDVPLRMGGHDLTFSVVTAPLPGSDLPIHFVVCPALYGRQAIYANDGDEHLRFAFLSRAVLECCQRMGWAPDIVHANDWHTALLPLYLKTIYAWDRLFERTKTVLTLHNLAYQGTFPARVLRDLALDGVTSLLHQEQLAAGAVSFLTTGLLYAHAVTAVSETYAREIQTAEHGMGLDGLLRARRDSVYGIVNGVDTAIWSPERDPHIQRTYSATDLGGKRLCRAHLMTKFGLSDDARKPVVGIVSRLTGQKGFDLCERVLPWLLAQNRIRLVVLGSGSRPLAQMFASFAARWPRRAAFHEGYDDPLAHQIEAGADMFLMPSRFEPCGLNQMYSLAYGTVPIVRKTGGLADTVQPWHPRTGAGTGFVFEHYTEAGLRWAFGQALRAWSDATAWRKLMVAGMAQDFSWERQIQKYVALYRRLTG